MDHYTIFDLPISVTNEISASPSRPSCDSLNNPLLPPDQINRNDTDTLGVLFAPGDSTVVQTGSGGDMGPQKPEAKPGNEARERRRCRPLAWRCSLDLLGCGGRGHASGNQLPVCNSMRGRLPTRSLVSREGSNQCTCTV